MLEEIQRRRAARQRGQEAEQREARRRFEDASPFNWLVVPCASGESAQAEARLRQAADSDDAEWIYLQIDGRWAAKRTPTDPTLFPPEPPEPLWSKITWGLLWGP